MDLKEKCFLNSCDVSRNLYLLPSMTLIIGRYGGILKLGKSQPGSWGPLNFRVLELSCITLHSKSLLSWHCSKSNSKFQGETENQHNLQSLKGQDWLPGLTGAFYFTQYPFTHHKMFLFTSLALWTPSLCSHPTLNEELITSHCTIYFQTTPNVFSYRVFFCKDALGTKNNWWINIFGKSCLW